MTARIKAEVKGDFGTLGKSAEGIVARAATSAMKTATTRTKNEIRRKVKRQFDPTPDAARARGQDFEKSFQSDFYPNRRGVASIDAAGMVIAKSGFSDAYESGNESISSRGGYLAVPLKSASALGFDRGMNGNSRFAKFSNIAAAEQRFGPLTSVPSGDGFVLGVNRQKAEEKGLPVRAGAAFFGLFKLQKSVPVTKKIDVLGSAKKFVAQLPAFFDRALKSENRKEERRRGRR